MEAENQTSSDQYVTKSAGDYAAYLDIESNVSCRDKEADVEESIEAVLTRLDEFYGMLDMIRLDSTKVTDDVLQNFRAERDRMKLIYTKIDDLEKFIEVVKEDYNAVEKSVKEAETEFGTMNSIKKALGGIRLNFWEKKEPGPPVKPERAEFTPPNIFSTSDYILPKPENTE